MVNSPAIYVIVVAAGSGTRFGSAVPKQFLDLCGRKVLDVTISRLTDALPQAVVYTVLSAEHLDDGWPHPVPGGASRSESVGNAVAALDGDDDALVLIHDGARPLVDAPLCRRILDAMHYGSDAAIPAVPLADSIIEQNGDTYRSVDRGRYRAVQTPQAFRLGTLRNIYARMKADGINFTDDMSALQHYHPEAEVTVVDGSPHNIKITRPLDLDIAALMLARERECCD